MKIANIKKDELELMSYTDITNLILNEQEATNTLDLFTKIVELLEMPKSVIETKIGDYYTSLTTDKRFILLDGGKWDLKSRHVIKPVILDEDDDLDIDDLVDSSTDLDDHDDNLYDEDEEDNNKEEYKNLVIVDEEDLDLEQ